MASSPRSREREEERRLNLRTLAIASAASAVAAAVVSQLWIAGTWIAAALTPVLVTMVSEALNRPTERIARAMTSDRTALPDPSAPRPARRAGIERAPVPSRARPASPPDPDAPPAGAAGPVRVYRQPARRPPRRRIAYGMVAGTAALAFVIGVVVFTTTELIAGDSIGKSGNRTTLGIGGSGNNRSSDTEEQRTTPAETDQQNREQPQQRTTTEEQPAPRTETAPQPTTPEETTTQPQPLREPAPSEAPTQTAPAP
jgi:hypothetical protein